MKLNPQNRNLAITVALGGATVAYVVLIFLPTQKSIAALQADLTAQQTEISRSQELSAALAELDGQLRAASDFTASWQANAPSARHRAGDGRRHALRDAGGRDDLTVRPAAE